MEVAVLAHNKRGYFDFQMNRGITRGLDIRAPEDVFATHEQIAARDKAIQSPIVDRSLFEWNVAKRSGDDQALRRAAKAIVDATAATFRIQGVPLFAHAPLPPQFVEAELDGVDRLPAAHRAAVLNDILGKFEESVKPLVSQQFAMHLSEFDRSAGAESRAVVEASSYANRTFGSIDPHTAHEGPGNTQDTSGAGNDVTAELPNAFALGAPGGTPAAPAKPPQPSRVKPRWVRGRPCKERGPGHYDFYLKPGHEGWILTDETGKRWLYKPDRAIYVDCAPDLNNDGQPDGLRMEPWVGS
jgi:hypothetical protein